MASTSIEIEIKALDKASRVLDKMERGLTPINRKVGKLDKQFDKVDKSIKKTSGSFSKMKGLLAGAITVGGITMFGKSVFDASSKAEDLKIALETVTGSAKGADDAFKFIRSFTEKTPFEVDQVSEAFMKLKSAGLDPSTEMMTMLGDVAAVSSDKVGALQAVTNLYSRTVAGGMGVEELDQLADRGIPVYDILTKKLGVTRQEVSEFGKTAEGALQMQNALSEGFKERFGGGMERGADSLSTKMSTLKDTMEGLMIQVGEGGLSDAIKKATGSFTEFLKENEDLALMLGEKLGQAVTFVTDGIIMLFENMDKAAPVFELIGSIWTNILSPALSLAFDIIVKLSEALAPLVDTIGPMASTVFEGLANIMTDIVIPAFNTVIDTITKVVDKIKSMIDFITNGINKVKEFGGAVGDKVTGGFSKAGDAIGGWVEGGKDKIGGFYDWAVGNSIIPDLVNDIGKYMDILPKKMVSPIEKAVDESKYSFNKLPTAINPNVIASPLSGMSAIGNLGGGGMNSANSNMNFNISNVNAGGGMGEMQGKQMRQYVEGIALQVANNLLRQNQGYGGLI
jgi:hypothetical protein